MYSIFKEILPVCHIFSMMCVFNKINHLMKAFIFHNEDDEICYDNAAPYDRIDTLKLDLIINTENYIKLKL